MKMAKWAVIQPTEIGDEANIVVLRRFLSLAPCNGDNWLLSETQEPQRVNDGRDADRRRQAKKAASRGWEADGQAETGAKPTNPTNLMHLYMLHRSVYSLIDGNRSWESG